MTTPVSTSYLVTLERYVAESLRHEHSGHDPWHALRVRDLGVQLAQTTGADIEVVGAAALLHDIAHGSGRSGHADRGAALAEDMLGQAEFPRDKIPAVVACIAQHEWLPGRAGDPQDPTLEYQAFADADRLDALGAIGIARTFAFGGVHGRPIWDPAPGGCTAAPYGASSVQHFYDKLLRLPDDMYTDAGRRAARERVRVMLDFLRTFFLQWNGNDVSIMPVSQSAEFIGPVPLGNGKHQQSIRSRLHHDPFA